MEKVIIQVTAPIDPSSQGEDDAVSIDMGDGGTADQSKVVLDPSKSPLVLKPGETPPPEPPEPPRRGQGAPPQAAPVGVTVVPRQKGEPLAALVPKEAQVRQLRKAPTAEDLALAAFVKSLGVEPGDVGLEEGPEPVPDNPAAKAAAAASQPRPAPASPQGMLERATKRALHCLSSLPVGVELTISGESLSPDGVEFVMGLGFLMGQGVAHCRDGVHYVMNRVK